MSRDWPMVTLGEVLKERREAPPAQDIAAGRLGIVAKIGFDDGMIQVREDSRTKTGMILVRPGDLLVSGINAAKGAIAIYEETHQRPIAATIHYGAYAVNRDRVDARFLWWLLRSKVFRDLLLRHVPGGIKTELKAKRLLPVPIPLPTIAEQQSIAATLDRVAPRISQARVLRSSSLEGVKGFMGRLVSTLFRDPECWRTLQDGVSARKGAVRSGPFGSQLLHGEFVESGVQAIGTRDVQANQFVLQAGWCVTPEKFQELKRYQVFPGDLLCTIVGASIGRFCVVPPNVPLAFTTKHIQAVTLDPEKLDSRFASFMLNFHDTCRSSLFSQVEGSAQPSLNASKVLAIRIPIPPLEIQGQVVRRLEQLQSQLDRLKAVQTETGETLDALLPSILYKAFKGGLSRRDA